MTESNKELYEFLNKSIGLISKLVNEYTETIILLYRDIKAENKLLREELDKLHKREA